VLMRIMLHDCFAVNNILLVGRFVVRNGPASRNGTSKSSELSNKDLPFFLRKKEQ